MRFTNYAVSYLPCTVHPPMDEWVAQSQCNQMYKLFRPAQNVVVVDGWHAEMAGNGFASPLKCSCDALRLCRRTSCAWIWNGIHRLRNQWPWQSNGSGKMCSEQCHVVQVQPNTAFNDSLISIAAWMRLASCDECKVLNPLIARVMNQCAIICEMELIHFHSFRFAQLFCLHAPLLQCTHGADTHADRLPNDGNKS